ncbi:MAG: VWA domain-containing protein [Chitinispirillaceae bacterium]|nr:VWA domain-containing protein [Chitinispirillaceae bacterium]
MKFGNPEYFLLWLLIPLFVGLFIRAYQKRKEAMVRFAASPTINRLIPSFNTNRRILKWALLCLFFFFLVIALTKPRFGVKMEIVERKGIDIIVALDISQSMLAEDMTPNRLKRAKHEIGKLIDMLRGDRIGIVVFAGESYLQCPLTLDYGAAKMFLDAVSTGWVAKEGTALADAIRRSTEAFKSSGRKNKVLILISDGEDHEGGAIEAAKKAAEEGVIIYTIGVGSESGVPIPIKKSDDNIVYKKDKNGNLVMTKLNPFILEKIAIEGKGAYFHAESDVEMAKIISKIAAMEKKELGKSKIATYEERYQIPLLFAIIILLIEFFIPERIRKKEMWKGRFEQ